MHINEEQLEVLLDKYLNSELDSTQELDAWFLEEIAKGRFREEIALHKQAVEAIKLYQEKQNFKKMLSAIALPEVAGPSILDEAQSKFSASFSKRKWRGIGIGIAAGVLLGVIYLGLLDEPKDKEKPVTNAQAPPDTLAEPALENKPATFLASKDKETANPSAAGEKEPNTPNPASKATKSTPASTTSNITFATIPKEENLGFTLSQEKSYWLEYRQDKDAELFQYKIIGGNALKVIGPAKLSEIRPLEVKSGTFGGKLNGLYFSWGGNYYLLEDLTSGDAWKTTKLIEAPCIKRD
jgi:hypothetical protein